ncbi:MAG: PadR family transcriptional regulator [Candidatus Aminicenantes bacterium]|nr:PadR family transcriptional regulator [Candidatus Aminicenantes bacterium]
MELNIHQFEAEMNRGFLQILVLAALEKTMYGYRMIKTFEKMGYAVEENTLYPLLRRLEKYGLIKSEWDVSESRPKKFYIITETGIATRRALLNKWDTQTKILTTLTKEIQS